MNKYKIKLLSGIHAKVEVPLFSGTQTIGSDDFNADIVLTDNFMHHRHCVLDVAEEIRLMDIDATLLDHVFINYRSLENVDNIVLSVGDYVQIGDLEFMIGLTTDELVKPEKPKEVSEVSQLLAVEPQDDLQSSTNGFKTDDNIKQSSVFKKLLFLSIIPVFCCLVFLFYSDVFIDNKPDNPEDKISQLLARLSFSHLSVEQNEDKWVISGYLNNKFDRFFLEDKLKALNYQYDYQIVLLDKIYTIIRFLLLEHDWHRIQYTFNKENNILLFTGEVNDYEQWLFFESSLQQELSGKIIWKNDVRIKNSYVDELLSMIDSFGLADKLKIDMNKDNINLSGRLSEIELIQLAKIKALFADKYPTLPPLNYVYVPVNNDIDLAIKIRAVNFGLVPYIILADNVKYTVNSTLPNGLFVKNISEFGVDLIHGEQLVHINFLSEQ